MQITWEGIILTHIKNFLMMEMSIIMILKGVLIKAKASNMRFDEAQQMLTKHITYLLNQCTRKVL